MWLLPIQKNEAIIYKTYNINSLSYTLLPLMVQQGTACRYPALLAKYSFCYLLCQNET